MDSYSHKGWSMDYQSLPPADVWCWPVPTGWSMPWSNCQRGCVPRLRWHRATPAANRGQSTESRALAHRRGMHVDRRHGARHVDRARRAHPSYIRLPLGWPGECCRFTEPLDFIGFDGGGGIGSGPGMTVGAALALRGSGRLPVAVLGDGDYLMGLTALWTAVHYRIPLLIVVSNNQSFFNDELHQERMARTRGRPIENRWVGLRMNDPPLDLANSPQGQGAIGYGPVRNTDALEEALDDAIPT